VVAPADWKELEISELCVPQKSRIDPRVSGGGDICVELEHIAGGSGQLLGVTKTAGTSSLKTKFEPGDVLFGKLRAYLRKYWLAEYAGVCSTEIWALSANRTQAIPGFLAQIVRTEDFIEAASLSYGTHMPRSDWAIVSKLIVTVPPLKEQEAIAEALSDADAAIESLDALIAKKRDVKQATMQQLLAGRTRLPGFTADWKEIRLGECLTIMHGKNQSQIVDPEGRYPILATGGVIGRTNSYLSNKPSVLIGRKGTIDRPQYMDTPFWTVDTLFYSEVKNGNSAKFLFYKFLMVNWKKYN